MPRDLPIGNGNVLISFDKEYLIRELCYPHVGEENHTQGEKFRFGVLCKGKFEWLPGSWKIEMDYLDDSLVTDVKLVSDSFQLKITVNDLVDFHENLFLRKFTLENLSDEEKEVRLYLSHEFSIYGNDVGDTAEFRPEGKSLLHYKGERYFLINIYASGKYGIDQYATGNKKTGIYEGTWKDAEDGILSNNPIAQGSVDSILAIPIKLGPKAKETCYYWIAIGKNWEEVRLLNEAVKKRGPESFLTRTLNYWHLWVNKEVINPALLPPKVLREYKRSLLITRSQINNCGSIIAGNDSDALYFNRDTYSYMWPRDGALTAYGLDLAGYGLTVDFFKFCDKVIEKEGFLLHKYTPSGSLASSWHPWIQDKNSQLPIQEDETALVIWSLWNHYEVYKDIEFIKPLYKSLIKRAADFMMSYRDLKTGLPMPSYDLWEERRGVLTFTVAAVYGGLIAASKFADAFGEKELSKEYREGALRMRKAMDEYLYLPKEGRFARMINFRADGSLEVDSAIDASLYGIFAFGAYAPDEEKVKNTMRQVEEKLWHKDSGGGLARYESDTYYRINQEGLGNPWFITTLWLAQYYIACAKNKEELGRATKILEWVADHALKSGVLAEQVHPHTHEPLSISPLTWSHAQYIIVVQEYLNKLVELEKCSSCNQPKLSKHLGAGEVPLQ